MSTRLELKNVKISTIQPIEKTNHPAALYTSLLDLSALDMYIPVILFYRPNQQEKSVSRELIGHLKESLSKVLVPYFPFAGRWLKTYESRIRELQCTDEGVPFIEASVDVELKSVLNMGNFRPNHQLAGHRLLGLNPEVTHDDSDFPIPALFIQVTQFKCGGVALNTTLNHLTADGQSMAYFLKAWSDIALHGETSIVPSHDRSLIFSREAFMELAVAAELGLSTREDDSDSKIAEGNGKVSISEINGTDHTSKGTTPISEMENTNIESNATVPCSEILNSDQSGTMSTSRTKKTDPADFHRFPATPAISSRILHVKRGAIESLKREAAMEKLDVTSLDLITAHIWRSLYNLGETKKKAGGACVGTYVEGRKRYHLDPLPEHYSGNVIVLAHTPPTPSVQMSSYSHSFAASLVHSAAQGLSPSTWKDYLLYTCKMFHSFHQLHHTVVHITSWHRFPVYDLSFDNGFGNPIFACWNYSGGYLPMGLVVVMPPPPQHSEEIIATIQLLVDESNGTADALCSDPQLLSLFNSLNLAL